MSENKSETKTIEYPTKVTIDELRKLRRNYEDIEAARMQATEDNYAKHISEILVYTNQEIRNSASKGYFKARLTKTFWVLNINDVEFNDVLYYNILIQRVFDEYFSRYNVKNAKVNDTGKSITIVVEWS